MMFKIYSNFPLHHGVKFVSIRMLACATMLTLALTRTVCGAPLHPPSQLTAPQIQKILQFLETTDP
ncbi:MAG: hypothetical protein HKL95_00970, partial [Phycisphaerae bacterium]|nr:hypothetical protein [Phycisphaerae bacterium]